MRSPVPRADIAPIGVIDVVDVNIVRGGRSADHQANQRERETRNPLDRTAKMADMMESPPLFDTNETKLDDLEDDDEDIFASAVQVSAGEAIDI